MSLKHGKNSPKSHIKGSKAIDFFLGSGDAVDTVKKIGILDFTKGIMSYHRGMFCDINKQHILRGDIHTLHSIVGQKQKIKYKITEIVYRSKVSQKFNEYQIISHT